MSYLVTFYTHLDAIIYKEYLHTISISGILMPVPRKISSSCGTCISFQYETELSLDVLLGENSTEELFLVEGSSYSLLHKTAD
ncbi:MAG: DUF3343 domain-containing protein [Lachnospiraceae bacterium]